MDQVDYPAFYSSVRKLKPRFYIINEGMNPNGYEKIPNSAGSGGCTNKDGVKTDIPMDAGMHHTNDMHQVVAEHLPEAKMVLDIKLNFTKEWSGWFVPLHITHICFTVYKLDFKE